MLEKIIKWWSTEPNTESDNPPRTFHSSDDIVDALKEVDPDSEEAKNLRTGLEVIERLEQEIELEKERN